MQLRSGERLGFSSRRAAFLLGQDFHQLRLPDGIDEELDLAPGLEALPFLPVIQVVPRDEEECFHLQNRNLQSIQCKCCTPFGFAFLATNDSFLKSGGFVQILKDTTGVEVWIQSDPVLTGIDPDITAVSGKRLAFPADNREISACFDDIVFQEEGSKVCVLYGFLLVLNFPVPILVFHIVQAVKCALHQEGFLQTGLLSPLNDLVRDVGDSGVFFTSPS